MRDVFPPIIVHKYGGTSVADLERIRQVARHIVQTVLPPYRAVIVVSAMGNFTDEWMGLASQLHPEPPRRELDMLLTTGERITAALLAIALESEGKRAISFTGSQIGLLTDATHGNAKIHRLAGDRMQQSLQTHDVVVVAGFQGVDPQRKDVTTLGRGGSDLTAVALAASLHAERCEIYKDVEGIYTADPRKIPTAQLISHMSWEAACELSWSGAQVLHYRAANLANKYQLPLLIRSSWQPTGQGTRIEGHASIMETPHFVALTQKKDLVHLGIVLPMEASSLLQSLYDWIWKQDDSPVLWQVRYEGARMHVETCIKTSCQAKYEAYIREKCTEVQKSYATPVTVLSLVGSGFTQGGGLLHQITENLTENLVFMEVQNAVLRVGVRPEAGEAAMKMLHSLCWG